MAKINDSVAMSEKSGETVDTIQRLVRVKGITEICFDKYPGDNQTVLEPSQKLYLGEDLKTVCLPAENIMSFLSAENTMSAPKRLCGKGWQKVAKACLSFVSIQPFLVPFLRDGKPVKFGQFVNDVDTVSGMRVKRHVARLKNGVPNPKVRPFLPKPWELEFTVSLYPNKEINETKLAWLFKEGGITVGFGSFRGVFGKFQVIAWEKA